MAGRGVLFAIDKADEQALLAQSEPRARAAWVAGTIEERWDVAWLYQIETLWFPVHYCLHGSSGFPLEGAPPEAKAIFGGAALGVPQVYSIDYKDADLVRRVARGLAHIRDDAVWARASLIERPGYTGPREEGLQVRIVDEIHALTDFYRKAQEGGRAVIFTVDM